MKEKFDAFKDSLTSRIRVLQTVFFYVTCLAFCGGIMAFVWWSFFPTVEAAKKSSTPEADQKVEVASSQAYVSDRQKEIWITRLEKERQQMHQEIQELSTIVKGLAGHQLMEKKGMQSDRGSERMGGGDFGGVPQDDVGSLRQEMRQVSASQVQPQPQQNSSQPVVSQTSLAPVPLPKTTIRKVTFQLDPMNTRKIAKSVDHYVPAGSFVRGALTSGVVAFTTVNAASNPQPIHIQITDFGTLPRRFKTDIKECFLIGAAYGDLACERVFVRLEKLSCVERATGEIIEVPVDGYVTGEDGANGLRGHVVDRSGPAMRNAFIGGLVGGIGNFFAQQQNQPISLAGGITTLNPMNAREMLQSGGAKGVGNAMEKLSEYYVKRAEQLQAVIEVEPGRRVHVVFKDGFDLNQTIYRKQMMVGRDHERRHIAAKTEEGKEFGRG